MLHAHGFKPVYIAEVIDRSVTTVNRILRNDYSYPDTPSNDEKYISEDMKKRYSLIVSNSNSKPGPFEVEIFLTV